MATVIRWWWLASAPIATQNSYIGRTNKTPLAVDSSIYELLSTIIPKPLFIYAAPLERATSPVANLAKLWQFEGELMTLDGFHEQDFGAWEGLSFTKVQELVEKDGAANQDQIAELTPEGGESFAMLSKRTQLTIDTLTYQIQEENPPQPVEMLCVAPVSVIRAAAAHALKLSPATSLAIQLQPLSLTILEYHEHFGWHVHMTGWTPWPIMR